MRPKRPQGERVMAVNPTEEEKVTVLLTLKQAEFLHALLDGFVCREAGNAIGTPAIIRKTNEIGRKLSEAAGFRWRHK